MSNVQDRKLNEPTSIAILASDVAGAMVVNEDPDPIGWGIARDKAGKGLYMVVVVMGSKNIDQVKGVLEAESGNLVRPDTFDDADLDGADD